MTDLNFVSILMTLIGAATPLLIAALGELVVEKSGVLNLGLEGMMLAGAVVGFIAAVEFGDPALGVLASAAAGALMALLFGFLTLTLAANQVGAGLALTIFGVGLSSLLGEGYVGSAITPMGPLLPLDLDERAPLRLLLGHNALVYFALLTTVLVGWFLTRARAGLILRAIGENDHAAHSIGYRVLGVRYAAIAFGGAMAGVAGGYYSLIKAPSWTDGLTAGAGWIALALVVFSGWRPGRLLLGAYLFGGVLTLNLNLQAAGARERARQDLEGAPQALRDLADFLLSPEFLTAAPFIATIAVLAILSRRRGGAQPPACLGKPFKPAA